MAKLEHHQLRPFRIPCQLFAFFAIVSRLLAGSSSGRRQRCSTDERYRDRRRTCSSPASALTQSAWYCSYTFERVPRIYGDPVKARGVSEQVGNAGLSISSCISGFRLPFFTVPIVRRCRPPSFSSRRCERLGF